MTLKELRQLLIPYGDDCQIVLWCQPEPGEAGTAEIVEQTVTGLRQTATGSLVIVGQIGWHAKSARLARDRMLHSE